MTGHTHHEDALALALHRVASGGTLSRREAAAAMDVVMRGECPDAAFGALFGMLHARGETVEELTGFAETMRSHVVPVTAPGGAIDTCGTGGSGTGSFNVSTAAAFVAAGAGATVAKHGNRAVSSSCGSADVLEELGGTLAVDPEQVPGMLEESGFAFLFAPSFHPSMRHAAAPRRTLGMRTAFNFLGPITNPAGVRRQVVGVSDAAAAERLAHVLLELGVDRALVVHGADGLDELTLHGPSVVHDVTSDGIRLRRLDAGELGLASAPVAALVGGDAKLNAALLRAVLDGSAPDAHRDVVLLNVAAGLVVAGLAEDFAEGVELGRASIATGAATDRLDRWIASSTDEVAA